MFLRWAQVRKIVHKNRSLIKIDTRIFVWSAFDYNGPLICSNQTVLRNDCVSTPDFVHVRGFEAKLFWRNKKKGNIRAYFFKFLFYFFKFKWEYVLSVVEMWRLVDAFRNEFLLNYLFSDASDNFFVLSAKRKLAKFKSLDFC